MIKKKTFLHQSPALGSPSRYREVTTVQGAASIPCLGGNGGTLHPGLPHCDSVSPIPYKPPTAMGWVSGVALGDPTVTTQDDDHHSRATAWRRSRRRSWVPVVPPSPSVSFSPCLTAADAPALQEEGIKLGWRNFKDCCRPEGLRSPRGDGQSCRINPIGSLARLQPVQSSGRARGSAGGDAGGG